MDHWYELTVLYDRGEPILNGSLAEAQMLLLWHYVGGIEQALRSPANIKHYYSPSDYGQYLTNFPHHNATFPQRRFRGIWERGGFAVQVEILALMEQVNWILPYAWC